MVVRLSKSAVGVEELAALGRVIRDGYLGMGGEVAAFERELADYIGGGREVICVVNGSAALHLAVSALDIGPGDEVLIPTITFVACFQMVGATGAKPVACDVRESDIFLDLKDAERRLTAYTRAIMPIHYASGAGGLDEVYAFARANGLRVIEDAAHAFGCVRNGRRVGAEGDIVCFSFDGIKNITCGEGGAVVTSDAVVAQRIRDARLLGVEKDTENRYSGTRSWNFDVQHQGFRYHMSNLMAAIGREQLKKLPAFAARRVALAQRYRKRLGQLNSVVLLDLDWPQIVPHIFVVRIVNGARDKAVAELRKRGIEIGYHYQPNHQLNLYAQDGTLPAADKVAGEIVTLPLHVELTDEDQDQVISALESVLR